MRVVFENGVRESLLHFQIVSVCHHSWGALQGMRELPFTNENFLRSLSLPNFYFHATTTYDILRMLGMPLSKIDFLGRMKMG